MLSSKGESSPWLRHTPKRGCPGNGEQKVNHFVPTKPPVGPYRASDAQKRPIAHNQIRGTADRSQNLGVSPRHKRVWVPRRRAPRIGRQSGEQKVNHFVRTKPPVGPPRDPDAQKRPIAHNKSANRPGGQSHPPDHPEPIKNTTSPRPPRPTSPPSPCYRQIGQADPLAKRCSGPVHPPIFENLTCGTKPPATPRAANIAK
jgi:hypothetical protein